jgi:hypothetical protein
MTDIAKSIKAINEQAEFYITNEDINNIKWKNGTTPIPANQILAKQQELITEYNSNKYQRDRAKDYPTLADQLDMQYWDKINGTNKWQQAINAVKQKYPK